MAHDELGYNANDETLQVSVRNAGRGPERLLRTELDPQIGVRAEHRAITALALGDERHLRFKGVEEKSHYQLLGLPPTWPDARSRRGGGCGRPVDQPSQLGGIGKGGATRGLSRRAISVPGRRRPATWGSLPLSGGAVAQMDAIERPRQIRRCGPMIHSRRIPSPVVSRGSHQQPVALDDLLQLLQSIRRVNATRRSSSSLEVGLQPGSADLLSDRLNESTTSRAARGASAISLRLILSMTSSAGLVDRTGWHHYSPKTNGEISGPPRGRNYVHQWGELLTANGEIVMTVGENSAPAVRAGPERSGLKDVWR